MTETQKSQSGRRLIAITGATGGLGKIICSYLAESSDFIFLDRNEKKSKALANEIRAAFPECEISRIECELSDIESVKSAAEELSRRKIDVLFLNAGVYNVPLVKCSTGYNNVFQINFVSQYYLATELVSKGAVRKVVVTSSVAHRYGVADFSDVDYSTRKKSSAIYGNAKRFLTFALYGFFNDGNKNRHGAELCVAHPGVTLTNMTNHYPKFINPIVKLGIKIFFPSPKKACRSLIGAVDDSCDFGEWIGPSVFDVWGAPKKSRILPEEANTPKNAKLLAEAEKIYEYAERKN